MQTIYRIAVLALLTGLVMMLLRKIILYLTRDKEEEKQFYTIEEVTALRDRAKERMNFFKEK
jgi:hypothetical protein